MVRVAKSLKKIMMVGFILATLFSCLIKCDEGLCGLEPEPSCGGDIKLDDHKNVEKKENQGENNSDGLEILEDDDTPSQPQSKITENKKENNIDLTDELNESNEDEKFNSRIETNNKDIVNKTEYYSQKKKTWKKPAGQKITYPETAKYEDLFLRQGHEHQEYLDSLKDNKLNTTNYYDFTVEQEEIEYIKKNLMVFYPPKRFAKNNQGNFLHFYKIAYEKKLPVMFTTDSMLYALNENIHRITSTFLENIYVLTLKRFFEDLVLHTERLKENPEFEKYKTIILNAQVFYGTALKLLSHNLANDKGPEDTDSYMLGMATDIRKLKKSKFNLMMKSREIDTRSLMPKGIWRRTQRLSNLFITLAWFNLVKFDLRSDLKSIYLLGKLIKDSESDKIFNELLEMKKFLLGEDRTSPNFLEVYQIGRELCNIPEDVYELSDDQIDTLNKKITQIVEAHTTYNPDLNFLNDIIFHSREEYEKYRHLKEGVSSLFGDANSLEAWTKNKLIDIKEQGPRLIYSTWEMIDIMHHAGSYREWVFNRYHSKETIKDERFMSFRDNINMQEEFEKSKYSVKRSMEKETNKWKMNMQNYYHYLLYKLTRKIKHSSDPIYKSFIYKEASFFTTWGAFLQSKRQILLMTYKIPNYVNIDDLTGEANYFPEVLMEPHLEFYKEVETMWNLFRNKMGQFVQTCEYFMKIDFGVVTNETNDIFHYMNKAITLIIKSIKMQESGRMDDTLRDEIKQLIYFDKETNTWAGWYYDLHNKKEAFNYDIWMYNMGVFPPLKDAKFQGANLFNSLKFPNIAILVVEDQYEKVKKMVIMPKYNAKENYQDYETKPDVDELTKKILDRE